MLLGKKTVRENFGQTATFVQNTSIAKKKRFSSLSDI
jgi:hypothetical protein